MTILVRMILVSSYLSGLLVVAGCAPKAYYPGAINRARESLNKLEIGMTKEQVLSAMGSPYKREMFPDDAGRPIEVLIYITQYTDSGPIPDSDKTPVCLRDGKLIGWGQNFYDRVQRHEITIRQR